MLEPAQPPFGIARELARRAAQDASRHVASGCDTRAGGRAGCSRARPPPTTRRPAPRATDASRTVWRSPPAISQCGRHRRAHRVRARQPAPTRRRRSTAHRSAMAHARAHRHSRKSPPARRDAGGRVRAPQGEHDGGGPARASSSRGAWRTKESAGASLGCEITSPAAASSRPSDQLSIRRRWYSSRTSSARFMRAT